MFVPKKMHENEFVSVRCPKNKDLFERIGPREPMSYGSNDGTKITECLPMNLSKMDILMRAQQQENSRLYDEYVKMQSSSTDTNPVVIDDATEPSV